MRRIRRAAWKTALILAGVHTCLVLLAVGIHYGPGWDDMSPTILVALSLYLADFPLFQLAVHLEILEYSPLVGFVLLGLCGGTMWALIGASVGAGLGALFGRRTRPGQCVTCGYDLTGNTSGRCPECGSATGKSPDPGATEDRTA